MLHYINNFFKPIVTWNYLNHIHSAKFWGFLTQQMEQQTLQLHYCYYHSPWRDSIDDTSLPHFINVSQQTRKTA